MLVPVSYCHLRDLSGTFSNANDVVPFALARGMAESHFNLLGSTKHLVWGLHPLCASTRAGRTLLHAVDEELFNQHHKYIPSTVRLNLGSQYFAGLQVEVL